MEKSIAIFSTKDETQSMWILDNFFLMIRWKKEENKAQTQLSEAENSLLVAIRNGSLSSLRLEILLGGLKYSIMS